MILFPSFRLFAFLWFLDFSKKLEEIGLLLQTGHVSQFCKPRRVCTGSAFSGSLYGFFPEILQNFVKGTGRDFVAG
jgi:hypothetical protein